MKLAQVWTFKGEVIIAHINFGSTFTLATLYNKEEKFQVVSLRMMKLIYEDLLSEEQWRSLFGGNNNKEFKGF